MSTIDHRKLRNLNLLVETRELIATAESGKAETYVYWQVALKIEAFMKANPTLTQKDVGARIGKGHEYVGRLLKALARARAGEQFRVEWRSGSNKRADLERRVPTQHKDRVEMAAKLLEDKTVVKEVLAQVSKAQLVVESAVYDKNTDRREKSRTATQQRKAAKAMPLPAYMARMVEKMNEWTLGLRALRDDLDELPEGRGRELVAKAAADLAEEAWWWADRLEPGKPKLRIVNAK